MVNSPWSRAFLLFCFATPLKAWIDEEAEMDFSPARAPLFEARILPFSYPPL